MSIRVHRKAFLAIKLLACPRGLSLSRIIQFLDINCSLFMRLHFTIGCHNRRRTSRCRHGFQFSGIQILFADHVHRLMAQADTNFPKARRMLSFLSPYILGKCLASFHTLLRGHIALAIPSLLETDPQILEHWGYADEDRLGKSFPSDGFRSRTLA